MVHISLIYWEIPGFVDSDSSSNPLLSSTNLQSGHKSLRQEEPLDLSAPADILLLHTDDMVD